MCARNLLLIYVLVVILPLGIICSMYPDMYDITFQTDTSEHM